jgi:hypothetical protein
MTIEEQIQKADTEEPAVEPDELDDIDKVRDDLQSTKQMLALEMRNKEAMERENKKLLVTIDNSVSSQTLYNTSSYFTISKQQLLIFLLEPCISLIYA